MASRMSADDESTSTIQLVSILNQNQSGEGDGPMAPNVRARRPRKRRHSSQLILPSSDDPKKTVRERKILQMLALAEECGFICESITKYRHELIMSVASRLVHRRGTNVFQAAAYHLTLFSMNAALKMFGRGCLETETSTCLTWKVTTMPDLVNFFGDMLSEAGKNCAGISRALQCPSEPTARVLAMLIPPLELSVCEMARGVTRAYVNMLYVLVDESGHISYPKDENRREIAFSLPEVQSFRRQILVEVAQLHRQGAALSSGWLQQLGLENQVAQARESSVTTSEGKRPRNHWNVECILDERPSTGRAETWYLVRWEGYHPSWERWRIRGKIGDPLETWEPATNVRKRERLFGENGGGRLSYRRAASSCLELIGVEYKPREDTCVSAFVRLLAARATDEEAHIVGVNTAAA